MREAAGAENANGLAQNEELSQGDASRLPRV